MRIIFTDTERSNWTWDPVANAYYWHRFFHHQPDLNFDNPRVRSEIKKALDFWLDLGVDGLRLDAIPYLYEREGTNGENLPETHAFLRELRAHMDGKYRDRMLLAEANQWPEDAVAYFGQGDECHMCFHFPVMPRMYMALRMEDRFPIYDILEQTPPIPDNSQWALFLRNHDELTLEMVTDEERDYMYRVYAHDPQMRINLGIRRRLAPLLGNNRRRIELLNGLLMSLPGTPVIYYGDEIGMGDNVYLGDRNGVRTPMQWSGDRNAGFSDGNRQRLFLPVITDPEYHYEAINVEAQQANPQSLLWWMKRLIALRKEHPAFGRGSLTFLHPDNRRIVAFVREHEGERILVVANMSRFVQYADLDLSAYRGLVPVEMFGRVEFPRVEDRPLFLTLGPHAFIWFSLEADPSGRGGEVRATRRAGTDHERAGGSRRTADRPRARHSCCRRCRPTCARDAGSARRRAASRPSRCSDSIPVAVERNGAGRARGAHRDLRRGLQRGRGRVVRAAARAGPRRGGRAHRRPDTAGARRVRGTRRRRARRSAVAPLRRDLRRPLLDRAARRDRRPAPLLRPARRDHRLADARLSKAAWLQARPARAVCRARRAEQHDRRLRRSPDAQALPSPRAGHQPGHRGRWRADRGRFRAHAGRSVAGSPIARDQTSRPRSACSRRTCPTRATCGSTRSTRSAISTSGPPPRKPRSPDDVRLVARRRACRAE